ncbi:MAG: trypsin-like serine peptidase [Planctomycetota bacterium]
MKTNLSPTNSGTWEELPGGDRLWRLRLETAGALWTVVGLETFRPQPGARLFAYDPAGATVLGPFTSSDVRRHGQLWLPPIEGDTVMLELEWPASLRAVEPNLKVGTVSHGYEAWGGMGEIDEGAGEEDPVASAAGACNVDINCPAGDDWQDHKRGVVQLLSGGYAFCTGSLVNSTANDCRPYVLTAAHCAAGPSTTLRFNYERPGCETGSTPPSQTLTGASVLASYSPSDFALLELDDSPEDFAPFFNGWRRSFQSTFQSWGIHHPSGDVKKISRDDDWLSGGLYWGTDHWRVTEWEMGTTEPGSSGSPLFDSGGRVIGQLHGGTASCISNGWDEYGKLSASWTGGGTPATRLSDWLDPLGTGAMTLDGIDGASCLAPAPELRYAGHVIDDMQGNGNGAVDPGETVVLQVRVANDGTLAASDVAGELSAVSSLATIADGQAVWPVVDAGSEALSALPSFTLHVDPDWGCGTPIELDLDLTATEAPGAWDLGFALPTGIFDATQIYSEDVEGEVEGWTVETPSGSNPWVTSDARSSSPSRSWHVANPSEIGESLLHTPVLTDVSPGTVLRFAHFMNSEAGYDGGVLEYTLGGATWLDAGPLIIVGAYNGVIYPSQASPLTGDPAWTGDLGGWQTVVVDLSDLAGSDVSFRWRFATDASMADEGWYVDDVVAVTETVECAPAAPDLPGEPSAPGAVPPFTIGRVNGGVKLSWGAPETGGPVVDYVLYSVPIGAPSGEPVCETALGSGNQAITGSLPDSSAFVVVARNASGEGSYGSQSNGMPRTPASANACPAEGTPHTGSETRAMAPDRSFGSTDRPR